MKEAALWLEELLFPSIADIAVLSVGVNDEDAQTRPRWLVNFAVDDVQRAVALASEAGGKPKVTASTWTPQGFARILQAPDGVLFTVSEQIR